MQIESVTFDLHDFYRKNTQIIAGKKFRTIIIAA